MNRCLLILSLFLSVCALSVAQFDDGYSPDVWNEDSWYDDELEKLGIVDQPNENEDPADQNVDYKIDNYGDKENHDDDDNGSIESQMDVKNEDETSQEKVVIGDIEEQEAGDNFQQEIFKETKNLLDETDSHMNIEENVDTIDHKNEENLADILQNENSDNSMENTKDIDYNSENAPEEDIDENSQMNINTETKVDTDVINKDNDDEDNFNDNDYQVEDNRSVLQDKEIFVDKKEQLVDDISQQQILQQTNDLLDGTDNQKNIDNSQDEFSYEDDDKNKDDVENLPDDKIINQNGGNSKENTGNDENKSESNSEEDTVAEALDDVKDDLNQLFDTINKLTENDESPVEDKVPVNIEDSLPAYEEKYKRPFREEFVLKQRAEYDEAPAEDFEDFDEKGKDEKLVENTDSNEDGYEDEDVNQKSDEYEAIDINSFADLFKDIDKTEEAELNNDDIFSEKNIEIPVPYINDALLDTNPVDEQNIDIIDKSVVSFNVEVEEKQVIKELNNTNNEPISSAELTELMTQFASDHAEDLDTQSVGFDKNVAPVYITLKLDEPTVITSPNYPGAYPTNNIIDWIIDGDGVGIEMNITDLNINGVLGDYLLVKPGGVDESGNDGLIFSYHLKSERKYRFLNVNKVFIRFEAKPGLSSPTNHGFSMSLKLVAPVPEILEPIPEPEPILEPPAHTLMVYLGGPSPGQFLNISEEFRFIIADMATMYVNKHGIHVGDANITKITQISQVSSCNINWPGFESCTGVTFGVPLDADDEEAGLTGDQLESMWRHYVVIDPFVARMKRLGIMEFAIPNDSTTLVVWLVIGCGVAVSTSMLALALWRWSCFEDYTRMAAYSDTDSVLSEKRGLDLYPTPHQAIPQLYDGSTYEDTSRVDMGGFANRSFARDPDLYGLDSDEDLALSSNNRSRSSHIQAKDIYSV